MLAHLKAKHRELDSTVDGQLVVQQPPEQPDTSLSTASVVTMSSEEISSEEKSAAQVTCDALCSLSNSFTVGMDSPELNGTAPEKRKVKACPKQHQLPMFLSKTYHMIDKCEPIIATWSTAGDNFVVKNVEKFASNVLPLYFKHSNFSSFARQLNFYGFRKLRTDPILTSDVDPRTACYVRFYHEKFQKDRPELLHQIKRATKSDQQSKDDVESLKVEVNKLKDCISRMSSDTDRKIAEMSYDYNRRLTSLSSEYDNLATLVTRILARQQQQELQQQQQQQTAGTILHPSTATLSDAIAPPDLMQSLSQAALSLQNQLRPPTIPSNPTQPAPATTNTAKPPTTVAATPPVHVASTLLPQQAGTKRPAAEEVELAIAARPRMS